MKKIVGKLYIPIDNSYSINVTQPIDNTFNIATVNRDYLAGTNSDNPKLCTILTQPFKAMIKAFRNEYKEIECIMVKNNETGQTSMVMFHEWGLDVKDRIRAVNESKQRNHRELPFLAI